MRRRCQSVGQGQRQSDAEPLLGASRAVAVLSGGRISTFGLSLQSELWRCISRPGLYEASGRPPVPEALDHQPQELFPHTAVALIGMIVAAYPPMRDEQFLLYQKY